MRLLLPLILLLGFGTFLACKNTSPENAATAGIQSDTTHYTTISFKDTLINFGSINMGETTKILFEFTNTGNYPLYLTEVKPGCGCTVAEYTKGAITPGSKGSIIAAFDSNKAHPGSVTKNIYVTANTNNGLLHTLIFTGEIKELPEKNQ